MFHLEHLTQWSTSDFYNFKQCLIADLWFLNYLSTFLHLYRLLIGQVNDHSLLQLVACYLEIKSIPESNLHCCEKLHEKEITWYHTLTMLWGTFTSVFNWEQWKMSLSRECNSFFPHPLLMYACYKTLKDNRDACLIDQIQIHGLLTPCRHPSLMDHVFRRVAAFTMLGQLGVGEII